MSEVQFAALIGLAGVAVGWGLNTLTEWIRRRWSRAVEIYFPDLRPLALALDKATTAWCLGRHMHQATCWIADERRVEAEASKFASLVH